MNILYSITSYPPATGGAQQHIHEIARRMSLSHGVQVVRQWRANRQDWLLGTTLLSPPAHPETVEGVSVTGIDFSFADRARMVPRLPFYYVLPQLFAPGIADLFLKKLDRLNFRPDLVHFGRIGRENLGVASLKLARRLGVPFVMTPFHHPRWVGWRYRLYLDLYRQADLIFALTENEKIILQGLGVQGDRIVVCGHGPSVLPDASGERFRSRYGIGSAPMILFVGQKYVYKGYARLFESSSEIWKTMPDARFVFIGPRTSESDRFFSKISDPRVIELGAVSLQEKCDALSACDVFVMPSQQESFGGVYVEAWMYRKPVVGGRIPAISSVIDPGENGLLVSDDPGEIATATLNILTDTSLARRFGNAGYQKALDRFTWEAVAGRVSRAYADCIERGRA